MCEPGLTSGVLVFGLDLCGGPNLSTVCSRERLGLFKSSDVNWFLMSVVWGGIAMHVESAVLCLQLYQNLIDCWGQFTVCECAVGALRLT